VSNADARVVAVVGPTAAGKSALGFELAQRFGMEIVNADAFCLYRGMDIGTAKPSRADRERVPHHLIDTHDVRDSVEVAAYQAMARAAIRRILAAGRTPLLVGGSGLYVQAVLDDLRFPGTDARVRARLESELAAVGPVAMHRRLRDVDPAAAEHILPGNGRRIVRALEVNEITGRPFRARLARVGPWCPAFRIGWDPGVQVVDERITARVEQMWRDGFVDEVRGLRAGLEEGRTAALAVGYRQILDAWRSGRDPDTAVQPTIAATRRLARKQRAWFGRDTSVHWVETVSHARRLVGRLGS
jgi:tRNA dimethylallyltransferase